jgi:hypothetical protein
LNPWKIGPNGVAEAFELHLAGPIRLSATNALVEDIVGV